jgi:hypothetical protein
VKRRGVRPTIDDKKKENGDDRERMMKGVKKRERGGFILFE